MSRIPATQTPAIYHRRVGDILVTTLNDGSMVGSTDLIRGLSEAAIGAALTARFRPVPPVLTINAFVLRTAGRVALIDTGFGNGGGLPPGVGTMFANLEAAGIDPAEIDTILLTHLHPDHALGLINPDGSARFPKAQILAHEKEIGFWLDPTIAAAAPEEAKPYFAMAAAAVAPYGARLAPLGAAPFPGVTPVPLPGHTPGHTGYRLDSGDQSLLIWGDIFHIPELQMRHPEASLVFDIDPAAAAATRLRTLDMVAADRIAVAGAHLQFPAFGHVARNADGFELIPEAWAPLG